MEKVGYTVYWAIYKVSNDLKLNAYAIRGDYHCKSAPSGTRNVRIVKREHSIAVSVGALTEYQDEFGTANLNMDWDWISAIPMPNE